MSDRQRRYKINRLSGMRPLNAALAAGYSRSYAEGKAYRIERSVKVGMADALERAGLTEKAQAEALARLTKSDDSQIQLAAWKHVADLKGQIGGPTTKVNVNSFVLTQGLADRLKEARTRVLIATGEERSYNKVPDMTS